MFIKLNGERCSGSSKVWCWKSLTIYLDKCLKNPCFAVGKVYKPWSLLIMFFLKVWTKQHHFSARSSKTLTLKARFNLTLSLCIRCHCCHFLCDFLLVVSTKSHTFCFVCFDFLSFHPPAAWSRWPTSFKSPPVKKPVLLLWQGTKSRRFDVFFFLFFSYLCRTELFIITNTPNLTVINCTGCTALWWAPAIMGASLHPPLFLLWCVISLEHS